MSKKSKDKVRCIICNKEINRDDAIIQMYVPYCKKCAPLKRGVPFEEIFK